MDQPGVGSGSDTRQDDHSALPHRPAAAQLVRRPLSRFRGVERVGSAGAEVPFHQSLRTHSVHGFRQSTGLDFAREVQVFESRYLGQKRTISQAKLQNRSPEIAELSLPAPDVLCVSSMQFQTTVREDLE